MKRIPVKQLVHRVQKASAIVGGPSGNRFKGVGVDRKPAAAMLRSQRAVTRKHFNAKARGLSSIGMTGYRG